MQHRPKAVVALLPIRLPLKHRQSHTNLGGNRPLYTQQHTVPAATAYQSLQPPLFFKLHISPAPTPGHAHSAHWGGPSSCI